VPGGLSAVTHHRPDQITDRHGRRLMCGVDFLRKLTETNRTQNAEMGPAETPVLPSNERQIRPLLTDLQHDGERIHVWSEVVQAGEKKITAELVQRKVDEFKASTQTETAQTAGQTAPPAVSTG